jgi:hypothetical protein
MAAEFAPQEREDALSSNCIGELEHHIHKVFASVRVPGEDFVYHASNELFTYIEDYVNEQWSESKPPLLILGESGLGKSALLSNWLDRRNRNNQRARAPNDEFVFWHAVGCSRQSTHVNSLIRRLITDLKTRFQVTRELPIHSERLSWELPRFLDLAAKKGKIIIVIDGVNRLMSDEENEATLAWLPLEVPTNVRFVLSATIPPEGSLFDSKAAISTTMKAAKKGGANNDMLLDYSGRVALNTAPDPEVPVKKGRVLQELERREWKILRLRPLDRNQCRSLIMSFIQKSVQAEVATQATGVFLTSISNATYGGHEALAGFLLFESHINSLLNHKHGRTPLFLRLFLRSAYLLCCRGYSLWALWDDWLQADSVPALFQRVFGSLETGYAKSPEAVKESIDRACAEGGYLAMKKLYPWHPAFQVKPEENSDALAAVEYAAVAENKHGAQTPTITSQALSNSVLQSLGDQQWLSAADQAETKFEAARKKTDRLVHDTFAKAHKDLVHAGKGDLQLMDAIVSTLGPTKHVQIEEGALDGLRATSINHLGGDIDEISRQQDEIEEDDEDDDALYEDENEDRDDDAAYGNEGSDAERGATPTNTADGTDSSPRNAFLTAVQRSKSKASARGFQATSGRSLAGERDSSPTSARRSESPRQMRPSQIIATMTASNTPRNSHSAPMNRHSKTNAGNGPRGSEKMDIGGGTLASLLHRATSVKSLSGKRSLGVGGAARETTLIIDPREHINHLPIYMRGGITVTGLGRLLGNALSLLYVSRHGLKEHEIWAMLATLTSRGDHKAQSNTAEDAGKVEAKEEHQDSFLPPAVANKSDAQRTLISFLFDERGAIADVWRTDDCMSTGMILVSAAFKGIKAVLPKFTRHDFNTLLELLNLAETSTPGSVFPEDATRQFRQGFADKTKLNYLEIIRRIEHLYGLGKRMDVRIKLTSKIALAMDGVDRLDTFVVQDESRSRILRTAGGVGASNEWENFSIASEAKNLGLDDFSLGPIIEESLLVVLCALGVLHSPENQVLLLPIDSDMFREVVRDQFVEQRGGEVAWHEKLIKHFQREANCMRRCEELPWHLQLCRKWYILKDTLTDLKTFELMYGSDLKDELMTYWLTLTEGPLHVSDEAAKTAVQVSQAKPASARVRAGTAGGPRGGPQPLLKGDHADRQRILSELDSAAALGLSEKEARKQLMRDKIAPFDVVEEFNRSVENWIYQHHPTASQLHHVVYQIALFMSDFSRHITITPTFLRLGVDMKGLTAFGVNVNETLKVHFDNAGSKTASKEEDVEKDTENAAHGGAANSYNKKALVDEENMFPTPRMISATHLYPYFRWVWIQFAWLALPSAAAVGKKYFLHENKYVLPPSALPGGIEAAGTKPATAGATAGAGHGSMENLLDSDRMGETGQLQRASSASVSRYWEVLKLDPSEVVLRHSDSQKVSAIRSSTVKSASNLHILDNNAHNLHMLDCRLFGGKPGHPNYIKLSSAKYRRSMQDEIDAVKGIPFSDHTVRSMRTNTLFPTVELHARQKNDKVEVEDMKLFDKARKVEMWGGKMAIFQNDLNVDLRKSLESERLNSFNQLYAGIFPLSDNDAEIERESNRMARMRNYLDKAVQLRRERKAMVDDLQRQLQLREQEDTAAVTNVASGEMTIAACSNRLEVLEAALEEALHVEAGYEKILDLMSKCPPFHDSHLAEVEQNLSLARQQLADLVTYRRNLYQEAEKARTVRAPVHAFLFLWILDLLVPLIQLKRHQLHSKISYYHDARVKVSQKRRAYILEHGIIEDGWYCSLS